MSGLTASIDCSGGSSPCNKARQISVLCFLRVCIYVFGIFIHHKIIVLITFKIFSAFLML